MRTLAAIALLTLAACGRQAPEPAASTAAVATPEHPEREGSSAPAATPATSSTDACGAGKLGAYLNVLPSEDIIVRIRETVGHDRIRVIEPGQPVTADLRLDRLNAETGVDGRIKLFRCG